MFRGTLAGWKLRFSFDNRGRRVKAIRELGECGPSKIPLLCSQLEFYGPYMEQIRGAAADAIAGMGAAAVPVLTKQWANKERFSLIEAELLANFRSKEALALLVRGFPDEKLGNVLRASDAQAVAAELSSAIETARKAYAADPAKATHRISYWLAALAQLGTKMATAVPAIKAVIEDPNLKPVTVGGANLSTNLRCEGLRTLSALTKDSEVDYFCRWASDPDWITRTTALQCVVKSKHPAALPFLIEGLARDDSGFKRECIEGIAALGPAAISAAPALRRLAEESANRKSENSQSADWQSMGARMVAVEAVEALASIGTPPPEEFRASVMVQAMEESQRVDNIGGWNYRLHLAKTLAAFSPASLRPHVQTFAALKANDSDRDVAKVLRGIIDKASAAEVSAGSQQ